MVNILLSTYDFNNKKVYKLLKTYLRPGMSVCIVPYSHDDDVYEDFDKFDAIYDYNDKNSDFYFLTLAFRDYGIEKVRILHPKDSLAMIKDKIARADILFFTGGNPAKAMERMKPILSSLKSFKGITMGASAGAMVQLKEFVIDGEGYNYSYHKGLGYVRENIDVIVHYKDDDDHLHSIIKRSLKERFFTRVYCLRDSEAIVIDYKKKFYKRIRRS